MRIKVWSRAAVAGALFSLSSLAMAADCIGNCGTSTANDGVVTLPPGATSYNWISTFGGTVAGGTLPGYESGSTNGSRLTSDPFFAAAGSRVEFWFNYITSDGSGFADYGWAQLQGQSPAETVTLFTARTQPIGSIVPGFGLPGVTAQLTPASVEIIQGGPLWAPLGDSSGLCYNTGCGYTGWVKSEYTVVQSGTYSLVFGTSNWDDNAYDSGMAFNGLLLNGNVIGDGNTPDNPKLPTDLGPDGAFIFQFTPLSTSQPVFIDPVIAVGYDYKITAGDNAIAKAVFPVLAGDPDGYEIYALGTSELLGVVLGSEEFTFASGVSGFSLRGISEAAMLDPANPTAFVTGLWFQNTNQVTMSQLAITAEVNPVPEPAAWVLMMLGLGGTLLARRRAQH